MTKTQREIILKLQLLGVKHLDIHSDDPKVLIERIGKSSSSTTTVYKLVNGLAVLLGLSAVLLAIGLLRGQYWLGEPLTAIITLAAIGTIILAMILHNRLQTQEYQSFLLKLLLRNLNEQPDENE